MARPFRLGATIALFLTTLLLSLLPLASTRVASSSPGFVELLSLPAVDLDVGLHLERNLSVGYHQLSKRVTRAASIIRGRGLNCKMSATIAHALQLNQGIRLEEDFDEVDIFYPGFEDEGWDQQTADPKYSSSGIQTNLNTLVGADPGDTVYQYFASKRQVEADQLLWPTGAYFGNGINIQGGVIIADSNKSPRYAYGQNIDFPISRIKQWSQAAFGEWEWTIASKDLSNHDLDYVIRSWVVNEETQDQVIEALRGLGSTSLPGLAGRRVFSRTSTNPAELDGFYGMLGTPNGASTGYLLASHKRKLGVKRVASIAVWNHPFAIDLNTARIDWKLNMLFTFEPVANPTTGNPQA